MADYWHRASDGVHELIHRDAQQADAMHKAVGRHDDHDWMVIPSGSPMSKYHRALLFRQDADNLLAFRHNDPGPNLWAWTGTALERPSRICSSELNISQLILTDLARDVGERKDPASEHDFAPAIDTVTSCVQTRDQQTQRVGNGEEEERINLDGAPTLVPRMSTN